MTTKIVHVASTALSEETGMGRIACRWRDAFVSRGYEFIHVGPAEVGATLHPSFWSRRASAVVKSIPGSKLLLVHEPGSGAFIGAGGPLVVFSHVVERRHHNLYVQLAPKTPLRKLRSRLSAPLWKWQQDSTDRGMMSADLVLVSN